MQAANDLRIEGKPELLHAGGGDEEGGDGDQGQREGSQHDEDALSWRR
jgi:hypothetical protein